MLGLPWAARWATFEGISRTQQQPRQAEQGSAAHCRTREVLGFGPSRHHYSRTGTCRDRQRFLQPGEGQRATPYRLNLVDFLDRYTLKSLRQQAGKPAGAGDTPQFGWRHIQTLQHSC